MVIRYEDLNEEQKTRLKEALHVVRMSYYYLDDHNVILLNRKEMQEYVFLDEINKYHEAMKFIDNLLDLEITSEDVGKTVGEMQLEKNEKIIKLASDIYAYHD